MPLPTTPAVATLTARRLSKHRGTAPVLESVDLTVGPRDRIGVIGPNGVGKTTLLRVLAGLETSDSGSVDLAPPTATVGYLAQERHGRPGEDLSAFLARVSGVQEAEDGLSVAALAVAQSREGAEDEYSAALDRYLSLGAADFEARRGVLFSDLGLDEGRLVVEVGALSGGERAKAFLAALLLSRFDILLLDEPTNDLDFFGLERLEAFLRGRSGGLVVVSHDRAFLDGIVTSVLELDEARHEATEYAGGFAAYLEARAIARQHAEEAYAGYVEERERLRSREREQRQWAVRGVGRERKHPRDNDKAQRDWRINRTEKQASKVRITEKALSRLEVVDKPYEPWSLDLDLATTHRSGDVVARLQGAVVERGTFTLGPIELEIFWSERVAILGPNGSGKTTLLAALLGRTELVAGEQRLGPSVVVGELGQERARFSLGESSLLDQFLRTTELPLSEARSLLAKFGLGAGHVSRRASSLSPGERTRAELASLMARGTNCLVLDEPTNHLDLPAIEQLEAALESWPATMLLVTHDRRLLEAVRIDREIRLEDGHVAADTRR